MSSLALCSLCAAVISVIIPRLSIWRSATLPSFSIPLAGRPRNRLPTPLPSQAPTPPAFLIPPVSLSNTFSNIVPPNNLLDNALKKPLAPLEISLEINFPILDIPRPAGLATWFLNHLAISNLVRLRGFVIFLLIAPTRPPWRLPCLSFLPSIMLLNVSVVDSKPIPAPNAAFPNKPNGPRKNVPSIAAPICGNALFIAAFLSLLRRPFLSPNKKSLAVLLFFSIDAPTPAMTPPRGPNGVIIPINPPVMPYFLASG